MKVAKNIILLITLLPFSAVLAATNAVFVNSNTTVNGAYKTISYLVCAPVANTNHSACGAVKSVDLKDASPAQHNVSITLPLKADETVSVISVVEKDSAGREIVKSDFSMRNGDTDMSHTYCGADSHRITVFDNYNLNGEEIVTCQDGIYR